MSMQSSDNAPIQMARLLKVAVITALVALISSLTSCMGLYMAFNKKPVVIAATDQGRVIEVVPLDKPYVTDSRVISFAEECIRRSFSHDFQNYRLTVGEATSCYTPQGARMYKGAMDDMLKDVIAKRMIMSVSVEPPVIVQGPILLDGRTAWRVQAKVQIFREGQKERIQPQTTVIDLDIFRVDLEENVRGISVNQFVVRTI